jgi:hypothetical protein
LAQTPINHQIRPANKTSSLTRNPHNRIGNLGRLAHPPAHIGGKLLFEENWVGFFNTAPDAVSDVDVSW